MLWRSVLEECREVLCRSVVEKSSVEKLEKSVGEECRREVL